MTISTETNLAVYQGNGATTVFAFPFYVLEEGDLEIQLQAAESGTVTHTYVSGEYTLSGIGDPAGGSVTILGTPITSDYKLTIERVLPYTQPLDLVNETGFYPDEVEKQFDRDVMQTQQLKRLIDAAITVPKGETGFTLPAASTRASKYLAFDAGGDLVTVVGTSSDPAVTANMLRVTSRAALKALNVTLYALAFLDHVSGGVFKLRQGAMPTDVQEGIYIASNTATYYWERDWDGVTGYLEWFGAVANDTSKRAENNTAFAAAFLLCPVVQMLNTDYYVSAPVVPAERSRLRGCGMDWDGALGTGTRIITNQASGEIILIGSKTYDGVSSLNTAPRSFYMSDFLITRTGAMVGGDDNAVGVWLGFSLDVQVERVRVGGANTHGFANRGVVFGKLKDCRAKRDVACSSGTDRWNGFLVDGSYLITGAATLTTINGNASLYIEDCQAEWNLADTTSISFGMYFTSKGTDTFVDRFEVTNGQYGMGWDGTGGTTLVNSMNDCRVRGATIDQTTVACYYFNNLQQAANVRVIDGYGGIVSGRGLLIQNCKGRVDFDGELYNVPGTSATVTVIGSRGASVRCFSWEATVHAEIGNSIGCDLDIYGSSTSRAATAIIHSLGSNSRNRYKMGATGAAGKIARGLYSVVGSAPYNVNNNYNEYNVTAISGLDVVSATTDFAASQEAASVKVGV
jgi:hypothetical protein